jgi:protein gp37
VSKTSIEWATDVWNPFTGCDRVSPGCANCYAAEQAARNQRFELGRLAKARRLGKPEPQLRYQNDGDPRSSGPGFGFTVQWDRLENPPRWPAGARVFVNSMSDVFHEEAPYEAICRIYEVAAERPDVNFLILTKRAERMKAIVERIGWDDESAYTPALPTWSDAGLPNVWLGVSIENRRFVHRADLLRETPAAVRFISAEPLLGPLMPPITGGRAEPWPDTGEYWPPYLNLTDIDWLIAGAESGSNRRRFDLEWVRNLRDACLSANTRFFFKQGSAFKPGQHRELDGCEWNELPLAAYATPTERRAA